MASVVDICNLALSRLGDTATVSSIDPPEGSPQAQYCATFYPIARDTLLEMHQWTFCTRRTTPAQIDYPYSQWQYAYAAPSEMLDVIAVLDRNATDDFAYGLVRDNQVIGTVNAGQSIYTPQPYSLESLEDGTIVILTNQEDPIIRYTARVTDTTKYTAMFVNCLSWLLASHLAGPLIKGDVGSKASQACYQAFMLELQKAASSDANNQKRNTKQSVPWMLNR
ncbi:hypothetical protein EBZ39_15350 [bacterium]|nr:hypothetical protein [bacterium]